jgi:hypothetical protein
VVAKAGVLVRAVPTTTVAAVAAALKVASGKDHRSVFEVVVFAFPQHTFEQIDVNGLKCV